MSDTLHSILRGEIRAHLLTLIMVRPVRVARPWRSVTADGKDSAVVLGDMGKVNGPEVGHRFA